MSGCRYCAGKCTIARPNVWALHAALVVPPLEGELLFAWLDRVERELAA